MSPSFCVTTETLFGFVVRAFRTTGCSESHATTAARALVEADAFGVFTHGTKLLPGYLYGIIAGNKIAEHLVQ